MNTRRSDISDRVQGSLLGLDMNTHHLVPNREALSDVLRGLWVDQMLGVSIDVNAEKVESIEDKLRNLLDSSQPVPHFRRALVCQ